MFGILSSISAEVFPAKDRGTGMAIMHMTTRLFGILVRLLTPPPLALHFFQHIVLSQGPIIAIYANLATAVPVYIAGALVTLSVGLVLLLPYEPRGKASI